MILEDIETKKKLVSFNQRARVNFYSLKFKTFFNESIFFSANNQPKGVEAKDSRQSQPETQPDPEPTSQTERNYP